MLLLSLAALALLAAGCGGDDNDSSSSSGSSSSSPYGGGAKPKTSETTAAASGDAAGGTAIAIRDFAFDPKAMTVKVGEKVTWTNDDSAGHNVVADDGQFSSDVLQKGQTFSYTPTKAGTISYVCSLHPQMTGNTLTVTG